MSVEFIDNSEEVLSEFEEAVLRGLEKCGLAVEGYAKLLATVDTGNMRNSITHKVDVSEPATYIGTNAEYGVYQEMGTGIYAEGGGGRPDPWAYRDGKGNWHWTRGNRAQPLIRHRENPNVETKKNRISGSAVHYELHSHFSGNFQFTGSKEFR